MNQTDEGDRESNGDQRSGFASLRAGLAQLWPAEAPLDLRIVGKTLLHAVLVGGAAGIIGAAFFAALEMAQRVLLESGAGYAPARAIGETFGAESSVSHLRLWLLALIPALGGLASGLLTTFLAPEAAGGGGDAIIECYHHGGFVRRRVLAVKALAAVLTLGSGGSGGREGPTMQIGGALGALVGRILPMGRRERRILLVAGIAAGIAAVFRTPLGAALLATEMLYRDDFESDALVPAILASVVAYAIVISIFGESTLFGRLHPFPFVPSHLVLYVMLALVVALGAVAFLKVLRFIQRVSARSPLPIWARPALGGLAVGLLGIALVYISAHHGLDGRLGVFGGGYGVAQAALSGAPGLPSGWALVGLFGVLYGAKMVASAFTIGSGGAAGDFAPSLVMGALLGAGFGHAAGLIFHDPRIDPAAFALVGMGTFYGGIAHAPLCAVVLVSELAGSYDLLVPMMLAVSVASIALRRWMLYPAQRPTRADSSDAYERNLGALPNGLDTLTANEVRIDPETPPVGRATSLSELMRIAERAHAQSVLVVTDNTGRPCGLIDLPALRDLEPDVLGWANAYDVMVPFVKVEPAAPFLTARARLASCGLSQLPVMQSDEQTGATTIVGYVGEAEFARAFLRAIHRDE